MNSLKKKWNYLSGYPEDFSMESRTYHSASVICILVLLGFLIVNTLLQLYWVILLCSVMLVLQLTFYTLSRFKKMFRFSLLGNGLMSYAALIVNYYINSGINGPTLFIFFFTFNLLVIVTPRAQHYIWIILHITVVLGLLFSEYLYPQVLKSVYPDNLWRTLDIFFTYIITLLFIYYISIYLRNYYNHEKHLAQTRALELEEQMKTVKKQENDIQNKNKALLKIAFIQSHELRGPVSSIMGLMSIIKDADYKNSEEYLLLMEKAVKDLDERIHSIIEQTEEIKYLQDK